MGNMGMIYVEEGNGRMAGTFVRGRKKERGKVGTHANMVRMESEHTSCCH